MLLILFSVYYYIIIIISIYIYILYCITMMIQIPKIHKVTCENTNNTQQYTKYPTSKSYNYDDDKNTKMLDRVYYSMKKNIASTLFYIAFICAL